MNETNIIIAYFGALTVAFVWGFVTAKLHSKMKASALREELKRKKLWAKAKKEGRISNIMGTQIIIPPCPTFQPAKKDQT